ncbi:MAG: hypothetical protein ACI4MN_04090 [Candidatus Coproplasma sp.]
MMVGSFIILAIAIILRVIAGTLVPQFYWLEKVIPYINYAIYGLAALFAFFIIIAVIRAIMRMGK